MNRQLFAATAPMTFAALGAAALAIAACSEAPSTEATSEAAPAKTADAGAWSVPRTSWGDPDLRGMWPLDSISGTPFQRPAQYGDRGEYTDEELAAVVERQTRRAGEADAEEAAGKLGGGQWFEWDAQPLKQTSLIVSPANGRIPAMTEKGKAVAATMKSSWSEEVFEWLGDFNSLDRCITRGLPASMINFPYNNGLRIFQSPGYVVIQLELIHETRIIPVDGRPQLPATFENWLGESRGRWEGDTLVIDTTHFNGESPMVIVGPSNEPVPTSPSLHIVERLTPTGPDTLQYEATVEDPEMLTGPWTMSFPWRRNESYEMFEYACHEGNTVVPAYIRSTSPRFVDPNNPTKGFTGTQQIELTNQTTRGTSQ